MHLPDAWRNGLAVALGCAGFAAAYLAAGLVWWAALAAAVALYGATLLLVRRSLPEAEVMLAPRISLADLRAASAQLQGGARAAESAAAAVPERSARALTAIAQDLRAIAHNIETDADDYRKTRRFIAHFLPHMIETITAYAALAQKAGTGTRIDAIAARIEGYAPVVHRINQACLENDFQALEIEVATLEAQMDRRVP